MKCTLRKVEQGVVATIDLRPSIGDFYISIWTKNIFIREKGEDDEYLKNHHTIIASNFGIEQSLKVNDESISFLEELEVDKEYIYTETNNQIIIEL